MKTPAPRPPSPAADNINTIAKMEQQFLERRSWVQRIGDAIGSFAGSITFVVLHVVVFTTWFVVNCKLIPGIPAWDPYPFLFLSMGVSLEAVLLSTFVLMKQNRESKRAESRTQLTLQIDMLAEQETTKVLQLLQRLCAHVGLHEVQYDPEAKLLAENTAVEDLVQQLKDKLPPE